MVKPDGIIANTNQEGARRRKVGREGRKGCYKEEGQYRKGSYLPIPPNLFFFAPFALPFRAFAFLFSPLSA
jgi:hypothetical protein